MTAYRSEPRGTRLSGFRLPPWSIRLLSRATASAPPGFLVDLASAPEGELSFRMPAGHKLIGYATEAGGFRLTVVPLEAPMATATGLEPNYECTNEVRALYGTSYPLTAGPLAGVVPNLASAGACTGAKGLTGPIVFLSFYTSGDSWGGVRLASGQHHSFSVSCAPAMTFAGAGVYDVWATTLLYDESVCITSWYGVPPSQYFGWEGTVDNGHQTSGTANAVVTAY